jgi:8-oxo-dGTP diphosphatase
MTRRYACGFVFSPDRARVLLIRKKRPAWQAGLLNGVGGKLEPGESSEQAMRRECHEETGLELPAGAFHHVITLSGQNDGGAGDDWEAHFFRAFAPIDQARAMTDELLEIHSTLRIPPDVIPNLRWIIPLLLDDEPASGRYAVQVLSTGQI